MKHFAAFAPIVSSAGAVDRPSYRAYLETKVRMAQPLGIEIADADINPILKPHARAIVRWAVRGGRRAIFAAFGLGKSVIQLEIARILLNQFGGRGLIVLPLGVRQEFRKDVRLLMTGEHSKISDAQRAELARWLDGRPERRIEISFIRSIEETEYGAAGEPARLYMTNYETVRDGKLDPAAFTVASLDEASVLRSFGSLTYQSFLTLFEQVRFRFVATATPSPNRTKEIIHYAGFLGVMDTGQALTRFFQRDSEKAGNLTLFPHKEQEFWLWVASWGVFLQRPSDLGFSDDGYELPELIVRWHEVETDLADAGADRDGQGILFRGGATGLSNVAREKRDSIAQRVEAVVWDDVNRMLTLNGDQAKKSLEKHVCPLQFDIVDRLIERYSNPGELVFDPFGGLFTVPYRALALRRRGRAVELNPGYFLDGVKYLEAQERAMGMPTLFDLMGIEETEDA